KAPPEDPVACLADEASLARSYPYLQLLDTTEFSSEMLREAGLAAEAAARAVKGVTNSAGAGASYGRGGLVLDTSHGCEG
ncbi:TldD/PmbA family protein, partial [Rhizobium leguminosarum]